MKMSLGDTISIDSIRPTRNPRTMPEEGVDVLMRSIEQQGLLQPIGLRPNFSQPGQYDLIYGHRRFLAVQKLGWTNLTVGKHVVLVDPSSTPQQSDKTQIIKSTEENLKRLNTTYMETSYQIYELVNQLGMTPEEVAAKLGLSRQVVRERLAHVRDLPEELKKMFGWGAGARPEGKIPAQIMNRIAFAHTLSPEEKLAVAARCQRDSLPLPKVNVILHLIGQGMDPDTAAELANKCIVKTAQFILNKEAYAKMMETQPRRTTWTKLVRLALARKFTMPAEVFYDKPSTNGHPSRR
jgi:ParB/RepB/Spo0J family partition protein